MLLLKNKADTRSGRIVVSILFILIALAASAYFFLAPPSGQVEQSREGGPPPVLVTRIETEIIDETLEALGNVLANEQATLIAKVTERVDSVYYSDGEYVEAGKLLIQLNDEQQKAALAEAQAQLDERERQLSRVREVESSGALSRSAIDEEQTRFTMSQARLDLIQSDLNDRQIRAPFDGLLGLRNISPGELVTPNKALVTISDLTPIKVDFTVPERYIGAIHEGQRIYATSISYPDKEFSGTIRSISPIVDSISRAAQARAFISNEDTLLRPGMLLQVNINLGQRERLTVPESALKPVGNRTFVMRLDEENVAHEVEVTIGERYVGKVEVASGLEKGDTVVTHGFRARPGQQVAVKTEDEVFTASSNES